MKIRKIKSKNHRKATQTKWITQKAKARASERDFFWVCVCAYVCVHFKRQKFMYLCVCVSHSNSSLLSLTFAASVYRSCVNTNSHTQTTLTHTFTNKLIEKRFPKTTKWQASARARARASESECEKQQHGEKGSRRRNQKEPYTIRTSQYH